MCVCVCVYFVLILHDDHIISLIVSVQQYDAYDLHTICFVDQDGYGWKIIHADVFRFPPHKSLFCSILGERVGYTKRRNCWLSAVALQGLDLSFSQSDLELS